MNDKIKELEDNYIQIKELKDLLFELDSKHSVSVPDTQQNINDATKRIVKLFAIPDSVGKGTWVEELSTWDSNETVTSKFVAGINLEMLEPTARNMHMLMLKVNELVGLINELK